MRRSSILYLLLAAASFAGCQALPAPWGTKQGPKMPAEKTAPIAGEPVLYAHDGSIVTPGASSATTGLPRRDVLGAEGSRAKILELYQRVVDERDRLQLSLTERDGELAALHKQFDAESSRAKDLEARMKSAEQSASELTNQNLDLAGRVTTAQIRRLEAEKKWLELSISLPSKTVAAIENAHAPLGREKTDQTSLHTTPAIKPLDKNDTHLPEHH